MEESHYSYTTGELSSTELTPEFNRVGRTTFYVVASERHLMHDRFRIASVCIAIDGPDLSNGRLYVSVWDDTRFLHAYLLQSCACSDLPIDLRDRLSGARFDRTYYFEINVDLITGTWCSIATSHQTDQKTNCVIRLKDFLASDGWNEPSDAPKDRASRYLHRDSPPGPQ